MFASVVIALIGANDFGIGFSTVRKSLYLNVSRIGQRFSLRNSNVTRTLAVFRENCFMCFLFPTQFFCFIVPDTVATATEFSSSDVALSELERKQSYCSESLPSAMMRAIP